MSFWTARVSAQMVGQVTALDISTTEWITLMDGLDKGLAHSNFTDFYYLCRTVLIKNEGDYDKLDNAFLEYFQNVRADKLNMEKLIY